MNIKDEIAWWTKQAFSCDSDAALIAFGIATGLKMAKADYNACDETPAAKHDIVGIV